jgi:hypothetical protein
MSVQAHKMPTARETIHRQELMDDMMAPCGIGLLA